MSAEEIKCAERHWIKETQTEAFAEENYKITTGHDLEKTSRIRLHPFIDEDGIITRKRLHNMDASGDTKHSVLLPSDAYATGLLTEDAHRHVLHGGVCETLTEPRERYFVPDSV